MPAPIPVETLTNKRDGQEYLDALTPGDRLDNDELLPVVHGYPRSQWMYCL
jgi:hypothetical protein